MKDKITVIVDDKEVVYEKLFVLSDEKQGIKYIVYTDNTKDEEGNTKVFFGRYNGEMIMPLESEKEKKYVEKAIKEVSETICKNVD